MKNTLALTGLVLVSALVASPAQALTFLGASTSGGTVATDYSSTGLVSFDLDFATLAPATLRYSVSADDLTMPLEWNAMLRNLASAGFDAYVVDLSAGSFALAGSVTRQFGGSTVVNTAGSQAQLLFTPQEFLDVEIGNALGTTPAVVNWELAGLNPGDTLAITVTPVPEPGTWGLMAAGLGLVGWLRQRRGAR
jgi:hypothetical protein